MPTPKSPKKGTYEHAAARLQVSPRTVMRICKSGKLPYIRVTDRLIRIDDADIDRYLASRRVVR